MAFLLPLGQVRDVDARRCGAKAATLSRLLARGLPVPPGFVIPSDALDQLIREGGLAEPIGGCLRDLDALSDTELAGRADRIRVQLTRATLPPSLGEEIATALETLAAPCVAVRSSSSLEDRADFSFAGQHDSFLNLQGYDACLEAILEVWASLYSPRALSTLRALGISPQEGCMAVLVQAMVPAAWGGVGFSAHPLSGDSGELVLQAVIGGAEDCVGGRAAGHDLTLSREPLEIVESRTIDAEGSLEECQTLAVARLLLRTEETLGIGPLDIEWAITNEVGDCAEADDAVRLLQARPMTSAVAIPGLRWQSPIPGAHWRRRWRLGEWLREPVTPLFASWAIPHLVASRECSGDGRLGWRPPPSFSMPTPWYCIVNGYFYARQDLPSDVGAGMPFETRLRRMRDLRRFLDRWLREHLPHYLEHFARHRAIQLEALSAAELVAFAETLLAEAGELWSVVAPLGYGFEAMIFAPHYRRLLGAHDPPHYTLLFRGYPNPRIDAQQALWELAAEIRADPPTRAHFESSTPSMLADQPEPLPEWLRRRLAAHHRDFGHLVQNLDFAFPSSEEDPVATLTALAVLVHGDGPSPRDLLERSRAAREAAARGVHDLLRPVGDEGEALTLLMRCFQSNAAAREPALAAFQLGWPLLRRILVELAGRLVGQDILDAPESIFFLEETELRTVIAEPPGKRPSGSLAELARVRRRDWQRQRALHPPETIPRGTDNPQVRRHCGFFDDEEGPRLVGQGVSAGLYRGRVRRVEDATTRIERGDVLVTASADPALTPLMLIAGALVLDVGGGASHASLVARELGLPTVVNTLEATLRLRDGEWVEIDGGEGIVRWL